MSVEKIITYKDFRVKQCTSLVWDNDALINVPSQLLHSFERTDAATKHGKDCRFWLADPKCSQIHKSKAPDIKSPIKRNKEELRWDSGWRGSDFILHGSLQQQGSPLMLYRACPLGLIWLPHSAHRGASEQDSPPNTPPQLGKCQIWPIRDLIIKVLKVEPGIKHLRYYETHFLLRPVTLSAAQTDSVHGT